MKPALRRSLPEVPLDPAPLVLVLCQLRFNEVPRLAERSVVEQIRDALGSEYSDIEPRSHEEMQVDVGPPGVKLVQRASASHVLRSPHQPWWILIGSGVATLAATKYSRRMDFMSRVSALRGVLDEAGVPAVQRVGVRYVSRVPDEDFIADLSTYVHGSMVGGTQLPLSEGVTLAQSLLDVVIPWDDNVVRIRTGVIGPDVVADPAIPSLPQPTWVLDIDAFNQTYRAADTTVDQVAAGLAENQYQLFRSIVTDKFLIRFGGSP